MHPCGLLPHGLHEAVKGPGPPARMAASSSAQEADRRAAPTLALEDFSVWAVNRIVARSPALWAFNIWGMSLSSED